MHVDGGQDASCCTYAGQARSLSVEGSSSDASGRAMPQVRGKLPYRYGWECTNIHTSELFAMLVVLRWRRLNRWNPLLTTEALLSLIRACADSDPTRLLRFSCNHLMTRLRAVKRKLIPSPNMETGSGGASGTLGDFRVSS